MIREDLLSFLDNYRKTPHGLEIFDMAFGKFFIMSSVEVNAIMFAPKGSSASGL